MTRKELKKNINKILLKAHREGVKSAVDLSARNGLPLIVEREGKIVEVRAPYKYVKVSVSAKSAKKSKKSDHLNNEFSHCSHVVSHWSPK